MSGKPHSPHVTPPPRYTSPVFAPMSSASGDISTFGLFVAGAGSGFVADAIMHPVDTLRARMQVQRAAADAKSANNGGRVVFNNTWDAFRKTIRGDGIRGLYRGASVVLLATTPAHALYFVGYETAKSVLAPGVKSEDISPLVHLTSGFIAELGGATCWVPMDVVKQRIQIDQSKVGTVRPSEVARAIIAQDGIRGMFRGYGAALATFGPLASVYFVTYEQAKRGLAGLVDKSVDNLPFALNLGAGAAAGVSAAVFSNPLDVIKTRIQVGGGAATSVKFQYDGIVHAAKTIAQQEGLAAFGKGLAARITWIAPGTAITIATYEALKQHFRVPHRDEEDPSEDLSTRPGASSPSSSSS